MIEACSSWATQHGPVTQVVEANHPSTIRVTTTDGKVWQVNRRRIIGDTLRGIESDASIFIPVSEITKVDVAEFAPDRTILLGLGVVVIAGFIEAAKSLSHFSPLGSGK